jgi:hypothetical protein
MTSFLTAYKVGALTLLSAGTFLVEWCCLLAFEAAVPGSNSALILYVCGAFFAMLGACLGATLGKQWRSLPRVGCLGSLLMVPFMFALWSFMASPPSGGLESFFWQACSLGSLGAFGCGMNLVAALGYLATAYGVCGSADAGKVVGSFHWWYVLEILLAAFAVYLLGTSTVWGIILAVVVVLMAVFWWL